MRAIGILNDQWCIAPIQCTSTAYAQARYTLVMSSINLEEKLSQFDEHWSPRIVSTFNGHDVMVVKVLGEFNWHSHPDTDDFFLVIKGALTIQLRDENIDLKAGEMFVVPKGVEHCPIAADEAHVMLIEPIGTPNTGDPDTAVIKARI